MYNHTRSYVTAFVCHLLLSLTDTICQSKYNYVLIERNLFELTYQFCESALYEANKIVIAVKPQDLHSIADHIRAVIHPDTILISIMAGRSLSNFELSILNSQ